MLSNIKLKRRVADIVWIGGRTWMAVGTDTKRSVKN